MGPSPNINKGSSKIFIPFANNNTLIDIAASPELLKTAFIIKRSIIIMLLPSNIVGYMLPCVTISALAPINLRRSLAKIIPGIPIIKEITEATIIACTAATEAL